MAAETTADPTARDLLRIAVEYAEQSRGPQPAYKDRAYFAALGNLYANLAQAAAAVEANEPEYRAIEVDEFPDSVQCQTCGHLQGLHMGPSGCLACNRRGGMCESVDRKLNRPVASGPPVDLNALRRSVTGESARHRQRPVNRGAFDTPTQSLPVVRREQASPFGPPDADATAEIPRATWSDERCETYGPNGGRCRLIKHGSHVDHDFPQPDAPRPA